jgi:dihydroorotate dehydrogenase
MAVDVHTDTAVLPSDSMCGGVGGAAVHAVALGNVHTLRRLLDKRIDIIGCGGVSCG